MNTAPALLRLIGFSLALTFLTAAVALADEDDPPARVARLADVEGAVSFQPGGTQDWVEAPLNRPLTTGDQLWSDRDSRAELQLDGSLLRLSSNTAVSFLNLGDDVTQIQLSAGTLLVRVRRLDDTETYEIDTPNLAFTVLRPGLYRITVDESGTTTAIKIRSGQGEVTGGGSAYPVYAHEYDVFSGTEELAESGQPYESGEDSFDAWSVGRDSRRERSESARYVSPDVVGYEDLDDYGAWRPTADFGVVWFPRGVEAGWAPYHNGHWAYIAPWGYTWVDDQPWGFAPFHYGRWISVEGAWAWVPCRPRMEGAEYVRPVYAPALVAWVGVGTGVAWFALGPREVYVPSYRVSRRYMNDINVSNTTVNRTYVNDVYNTTIVNKTVNVTNVTYANRNVRGAVAATTSQAFTNAQPVSRNSLRVDQRAIAGAQVRAFAPAAVPMKQALLGTGRPAAARPPASMQTRTGVARTTPPPPPPNFERLQEAIKNNAGSPLSTAQVRTLQTTVAPRPSAVNIAPPATVAPSRANVAPAARVPAKIEPDRPVPVPVPVPVHPNEIPHLERPASPSAANSALERQHLQEQQQLRARQDEERLRMQQQQEAEHAQLEKQRADEARRQQLEEQHQQQTQLLLQQHLQEQQRQQQAQAALREQLQEQQQMRERQREQVRQQPSQAQPPNRKEERPPNERP